MFLPGHHATSAGMRFSGVVTGWCTGEARCSVVEDALGAWFVGEDEVFDFYL